MPRKAMDILTESMFYVLMALSRGEKCGVDIVDYIDRLTKNRLQIGPATLYTILAKFEKARYIQEILVEGRKRTYRITEKGITAYRIEVERLKQCVADATEGGEENV